MKNKIFKQIEDNCSFEFLEKESNEELIIKNKDILPPSFHNYSEKRKSEFILGRICAQRALSTILNENIHKIGKGDNGEPLWPDGVVGSISHSRKWVCAVASKELNGIGIDVETIIDNERLKKISSRFIISSSEKDIGSDARNGTIIFSAKEALYKALFPTVQEYFGFSDAEVTSITNDTFSIRVLRKDGVFKKYQDPFCGYYTQIEDTIFTLIKF